MTTLTVAELERTEKLDLGVSSWLSIDQPRVDLFAEATGDKQWIHVDPAAAADGPFGGTVAHGYLTLALLPRLLPEVLTISDSTMGVNYGIDRIRFPTPVLVGSRIRLRAVLERTEQRGSCVLFHVGVTVEVEGQDKPALVGEVLYLAC